MKFRKSLQSGGIKPLVDLLRGDPGSITAELAAVALRNMALQNEMNKAAIISAGGLEPLLRLLSAGLQHLVHPLQCEVSVTRTLLALMLDWSSSPLAP